MTTTKPNKSIEEMEIEGEMINLISTAYSAGATTDRNYSVEKECEKGRKLLQQSKKEERERIRKAINGALLSENDIKL